MKIAPYAKAFVAGAIAGLTSLGAALADNDVTTAEIVVVVVAFLSGLGITYAVPNKASRD